MAMAHALGGDVVAAQGAARRAVTLFEELGNRQGLAGVLPMTTLPNAAFEFTAMVGGSTISSAVGTLERALALTREIDWRSGEAYCLALLGEMGRRGRFRQGAGTPAREHCRRRGDRSPAVGVQARWGLARLFGTMGLPEEERDQLERVRDAVAGDPLRGWMSLAAAGLASALVSLGKREAAASVLAEALTSETPMRAQGERLLWAAQAQLALASGQARDALAVIDQLYASAINLTTEGEIPYLAQLKAMSLAALGEWAQAEALLREAQITARTQGALPTLRELHLTLGEGPARAEPEGEARREEAAAGEVAERLAAHFAGRGAARRSPRARPVWSPTAARRPAVWRTPRLGADATRA